MLGIEIFFNVNPTDSCLSERYQECSRAKINSGRWDFRVSGMKFDNVTQWVLPKVDWESPT